MQRLLLAYIVLCLSLFAQTKEQVIVDYTNYNVGDMIRTRIQKPGRGFLSIRYAGETDPIVRDIPINGSTYTDSWKIPSDARTGRYEVDMKVQGAVVTRATSFAVHRQRAKVMAVDLDKTFYTAGDAVNPTVVVKNISDQPMNNLQVEFEAYTYPWIAPSPDDSPAWKTIVARSLTLNAAEEKTFHVHEAAVVQASKEPVISYYSVVIRDSHDANQIYDLAFAPPAFVRPANQPLPKQYPFLYLYGHLSEMEKAERYRHFYPPETVSDAIAFETSHTMFATGKAPEFSFSVKTPKLAGGAAALRARVLNEQGKELEGIDVAQSGSTAHQVTIKAEPPGLYRLRVELSDAAGNVTEHNELEFAINDLPKSILIFCAHQDDDTAHPGIIRAAVENHIPVHVVYLTSGDAGGCDRFYMHSCDAARAMDFGEVRMDEARASLGHLGVPRENISFLGLPDGGMEQIWFDHPHASDPYLSVLLASDHSPYQDVAFPNLAYSRDAVVHAAKEFIRKYQPDLIITGHPDERHVDHRTNNWIVVQAMQELVNEGALSRDTKLSVDVAYGAQPGQHAPYRYSKDQLFVSGEAAKLGQEASWFYQSQDGNHEQASIVDFSKLPRQEPYPHFRVLDWFDHSGWNEKRSGAQ